MLEVILMMYVSQIFLFAMAALNMITGIRMIARGEAATANKNVLFGMFYGVLSLLIGAAATAMLK